MKSAKASINMLAFLYDTQLQKQIPIGWFTYPN
jgi:hypothetical protein